MNAPHEARRQHTIVFTCFDISERSRMRGNVFNGLRTASRSRNTRCDCTSISRDHRCQPTRSRVWSDSCTAHAWTCLHARKHQQRPSTLMIPSTLAGATHLHKRRHHLLVRRLALARRASCEEPPEQLSGVRFAEPRPPRATNSSNA